MVDSIQRWTLRVAPIVALPSALVSLYMTFFRVPSEMSLGLSQRIFYWHVPSATARYLAFVIAGVASVAYLVTRRTVWDHTAHAAVSTGMVFATIVIATGAIWAHTAWGTWWTWDVRLTTFAILWLIFAAYLLLRNFARGNEMEPRYAAVLAIVGVLNIPLVKLATQLFPGLHPQVINNPQGGIEDPNMVTALMWSFAGCLATMLWLWALRLTQLRLGERLDLLEGELAFDDRLARGSVRP